MDGDSGAGYVKDEASELVVEWLASQGQFEALRELEARSGLSVFGSMGEEIDFLRDLVLQGEWKDVESSLQVFQGNTDLFDHTLALFFARKQRLLELVAKDPPAKPAVLRTVFDSTLALGVASAEEANRIKTAISSMNVEHVFPTWTPMKGRYDCFQDFLDQCGLFHFRDITQPRSFVSVRPSFPRLHRMILEQKQQDQARELGSRRSGLATSPSQHRQHLRGFGGGSTDSWRPPRLQGQAEQREADQHHSPTPPAVAFDVLFDNKAGEQLDMKVPRKIREAMEVGRSRESKEAPGLQEARESPPMGRHLRSLSGQIESFRAEMDQSMVNAQSGLAEEDKLKEQMEQLANEVTEMRRQLMEQKEQSSKGAQERTQARSVTLPEAESEPEEGYDENLWGAASGGDEAFATVPGDEDYQHQHVEQQGPADPECDESGNEDERGRQAAVRSSAAATGRKLSSPPFQDLSNKSDSPTMQRPGKQLGAKSDGLQKPLDPIDISRFHPCICLLEESQPIRAVAFDRYGANVLSGTNSRSMVLTEFPEHMQQLGRKASCLAPLGGQASPVKGARGKTLRFGYEEYLPIPKLRLQPSSMRLSNVHLGSVYCLDWRESLVASGSNDKLVKLWAWSEDGDLEPTATFAGQKSTIRAVKLSVRGGNPRVIGVGGGDNHVRIWDATSQQMVGDLKGHTSPVFGVDLSADERSMLTCSADGTLRHWDPKLGKATGVLRPPGAQCGAYAVSLSPTSDLVVASGHQDGCCRLWDLRKQQVLEELHHHKGEVRSLDFNASGSLLLTASFDGSVGIVSMDAFQVHTAATLHAHADKVLQVKWHPSEPFFLSSSADNTVKAWTAEANALDL